MDLSPVWVRDRIDVIAAVAGLLTGIIISFLNLVYSNAYTITVGPLLAIACLLYLLFRRKLLIDLPNADTGSRVFLTASIIFWISFAISTCCLNVESLHRPLAYFIMIAVAASVVAIQIIYCRGKSTAYLILFEILLISLSVSASAYWVFPSIPGIDTWGHSEYVRSFVENGGIPGVDDLPQGIGSYYLYFPIAHLNSAVIKLVGGVDYKAALFLGISLPLMLASIFVFLIARSMTSTRVGLLAMLMFGLSTYFIGFGIQPVANSLGLALFLVITYLLLRYRGRMGVSFVFIFLLLLAMLIVTHTVSAFIMFSFLLAFLIGIYIYRLLYRERSASGADAITPVLVGFFGVFMLSYWIYMAYLGDESFFDIVVGALFKEAFAEAGFGHYELPYLSGTGQVVNILGFMLLLFFGVLGCLIWLSRKCPGRTQIGLIAALIVILGMPLGLAAFGIEAFVPDRWFAFSYAILAVVAALAIFTVSSQFRYRWLGRMLLIGVVFVSVFFMISNKITNVDSPIYASELTRRLVYTDAELALGEKVVEVYDGTVVTDLDYGLAIIHTYLQRVSDLDFRIYDEEQLDSGIVLWREVMTERPVRSPPAIAILGDSLKNSLEGSHHLVYSNSDSKAYLTKLIL